MSALREEHRTGLDYLQTVTQLLQRVRSLHPTAGLYEAADLQWWWRYPRSTDTIPQLFWFDELGLPAAAVIATDWGDRVALDPMVMPDATPEWIAAVVDRAMTHADQHGFETVCLEVDHADHVLAEVLVGHGFAAGKDAVVESWLSADARPELSSLHDDYRLSSRDETYDRPYHNLRSGPDIEQRLLQTSLYRPDLDLVVHDGSGEAAALGLFWFDEMTSTGLVEPMRTNDEHQRRGLARHVLTAGIDRLVEAGATRVKICFEPDNPPARDLYLSVGFEPVRETVTFSRSASSLQE